MIDLRGIRRRVERELRDSAPYRPVDGALPMTKLWRCPANLYDLMTGEDDVSGRGLLWLREDARHKEDMRDVLDRLGLYGQVQPLSAHGGRLNGSPHGELHVNGESVLLHFVTVGGDDFAWIKDRNRALQRDYEKAQVFMLYGEYQDAVVWYKNVETGEVWPIGVWPHQPTQSRLDTKARQVLEAVDRQERPLCTCGRHDLAF